MVVKEMGIVEIVQKYPRTAEVFKAHGMGCLGCMAAKFENLEQGAAAHGIDLNKLIADLNEVIKVN